MDTLIQIQDIPLFQGLSNEVLEDTEKDAE